MRENIISFLLLLFFISSPLKADEPRQGYFIQQQILDLLNPSVRPSGFIQGDGVVYVELTNQEADSIASFVHESTHKCGGGIELVPPQDTQAFGAEDLLANYWKKPAYFEALAQTYQIRFKNTSRQLISSVQLSRQQSFLSGMTAFADRYSSSTNGQNASNWIKSQIEAMASAAGRSNVTAELIPTTNRVQPSILVKLAGTDPSLSALVIGGHMDTTAPSNKPGADDDGSGSSTVAEIYQTVINSPYRFKRDIYFVFYAAEEVGLVGSGDVVRAFQNRGIRVYAVLQYDMSGYKSPADTFDMYMVSDNVDTSLTTFVRSLAKEYLGIATTGNTYCNYKCSDHARWNDAGIPSAFPFEASFENYNPTIHTSNDNVVNWDYAIKFTKLGVSFVSELAEPVDYSSCYFCRFK